MSVKNILLKAILVIALYFSFGGVSYCQRHEKKMTIGITYQPFVYWCFNKGEFNTIKQRVIKPRGFNGTGYGLFINYQLLDNISIGAEIAYTKQNQKYKFYASSDVIDSVITYTYANDRISTFDVIKAPFLLGFDHEIGYKTGFKISGFIGPQLSYLNAYKIEMFQHPPRYILDNDGLTIGVEFPQDSTSNHIKISKEHYYQAEYFSTGSLTIKDEAIKKAFHDFTVGGVAGVEVSKSIFENLVISVGGRFEYDFTNMEKVGAENVSFLDTYWDLGGYRPPSHHIRAGFSFKVGYRF